MRGTVRAGRVCKYVSMFLLVMSHGISMMVYKCYYIKDTVDAALVALRMRYAFMKRKDSRICTETIIVRVRGTFIIIFFSWWLLLSKRRNFTIRHSLRLLVYLSVG